MIKKRIISAITGVTMLISMTSVLSGCSMKEFFTNEKSPETAVDDGNISKGEWLAMVNDAFGMQVDETSETGELDAAKEWGVIGEDEEIDADAPVDDRFVTSTLMRAAGYASPDSSDQDVINAAIQHGVISDPNASLTDPGQAIDSLKKAQDSWSHQTFEEHFDVQLVDGVYNFTETINVDDINISGGDVVIPSEYAGSLSKDSVYVLPKDKETGKGGAYKVLSVVNHGDGTTTVKSVPAKMEEVYKKVDVSGQFAADMSTFEPANPNVKVVSSNVSGVSNNMNEGMIMPLSCAGEAPVLQQLGSESLGQSINLKMDLGDDYSVEFALKDVVLNADVDWDFGLIKGLEIERVYMAVDYTTEVKVEKEFGKTEGSIELGVGYFLDEPTIDIGKFAVYICPGISVNLRVKASFEASGKISVSVTTENTKGFEMTGSSFRSINETNTSSEVALTGEAGIYGTLTVALSLDYLVDELDLLSLELKVGPTLKAEAKIQDNPTTGNDMLCLDISGYLKIELKLFFFKDIMELLGMESSITLVDVDQNSSPVVWGHIHYEDFVRTPGDACTADGAVTEAVTTEAVTIPVGIFELEKSYISVSAGTSANIGMKSLPSGYSMSDIVWSSSDSSKVSVDSNGNVKAISPGTAQITVKTSDGKYKASCAVTVLATVSMDYSTYGYAESPLMAA